MTDLLGRITQLTGEGGPVIPRGFAKLALAEHEMDRLAAERDFWIKLFNRLEAAVTHHRKATADLATDADDALYAARAKILSAAHDGPNRGLRGRVVKSDQSRMVRCRVLVGDSVYEDAAVTLRDGILWVEFDADDMEDLAIPLAELLERPEASKSA